MLCEFLGGFFIYWGDKPFLYVMGWIVFPHDSYVEVMVPTVSECDYLKIGHILNSSIDFFFFGEAEFFYFDYVKYIHHFCYLTLRKSFHI